MPVVRSHPRPYLSFWPFFFSVCLFGCTDQSNVTETDIYSSPADQQSATAKDPVCEAATPIPRCPPGSTNDTSCGESLYIPLDAYCATSDCPMDVSTFEAEFTTCETSPEDRHGNCPLRRYIGCGARLYYADYDESGISAHVYHAKTLKLRGMFFSSDTPLFCNQSFSLQVGERYPPPSGPTACPEYIETFCCFDEI